MCGIAGYLGFDGQAASPTLLKRMGEAIAHRGPDGEGQYIDGPCGLAHRRLAIIDLSPGGHQPMATEDGRYVISYNGEVFNYQELRIELESQGWHFRSNSDTEVVLKAYAHWGKDALTRFNGQFAIAVWDRHERSLFLARDRYGIKPLYLFNDGKRVVFGSEVKAMARHPSVAMEMDKEGLLEYLTFQNFFSQRTLFKNVSLLPAGTWMSVHESGRTQSAQYWDFHFAEPEGKVGDVNEYREELDRLLRQAEAAPEPKAQRRRRSQGFRLQERAVG